ncbi:MAG: DUF58 domain-containing protein [Bacteroidetes bacterium]|nr:MAG: DUF58 domain-containing protein [Bacteroidota bacterium]
MEYSIDHNRLQQFGSLEFLARQVVEGFITGLHKSPFHGFSVEFAEHRQYNSGESIKHIDWKLYGRTDKLYVKRYEEETNLRCQIIIDNSSSMYFPVKPDISIDNPNKITFSIYAAAALINLLQRQRDAVGLSLFSDKIELNTRARSTTVHMKHLFTEMEKLLKPIPPGTRKSTGVAEAIHQIADMIHQRSLVVIFSDMLERQGKLDEMFSALQHLRYNKHEVILFHVVDKSKEIDFEYDNRPYKFVDMESGEEMKLSPLELRKQYVESVGEFVNELKLRCGKYMIDFVAADINAGFSQILHPYLIKREKLY